MKISKHLRLLRFLEKHRVCTIKHVQILTNANNPYRVIEHLKRHIDLGTVDVVKEKRNETTRFRIYHLPRERHVAYTYAKRQGWRIAA